MKIILNRIGYAIAPTIFLVAAYYLFKTSCVISGSICIFVAVMLAKN